MKDKTDIKVDFSDLKKTIDNFMENQKVSMDKKEKTETKIPKLSLTINVTDEDYGYDMEFLKRTLKATDLCSFIWDFQTYLRSIWDGDRKLTNEQDKLINEIYDEWFKILDDNGIKLEEIYS